MKPESETTQGLLHDGTPCPHGLWIEFTGNDTCLICGYQTHKNKRFPPNFKEIEDAKN